MPPNHKRRGLTVRYKNCGRIHETSSELSWNSSTVVDYFLGEQGRKKGSNVFKKYDAPDAVHFNEWAWNITTELTWKENTSKREQFCYILDSRRLPKWRNENYKNVKSEYLKPRKRYDLIPPLLPIKIQPKRVKPRKRKHPTPPPKDEKVLVPLKFPLAIQCVCEKENPVPETQCPVACPVDCSFDRFLPGCSPLEVGTDGESSCCVNLSSSDCGNQDNQSASRPCLPTISCGGIGSHGYSLFSKKLNCAFSPVQDDTARQSSPGKKVASTSRSATPTKTHSPSDSPKVSDKNGTAGLMDPPARGIGRFVLKASDSLNMCSSAGDSACVRIALSEGPVNLLKLESWAKELAESSHHCCVRNVQPYVRRLEDCIGFACIGTPADSREGESRAKEVADDSESSPRRAHNSREVAESSYQGCVPSFGPYVRKLEDGYTACTGFACGETPADEWEAESRQTTDSEVSENLALCNSGDPCHCIGFGCFGGKR
ncbi:hypothetical protein R1sor_017600 [Riccia sorocarpa]|uniref:Uncharacterized protein n=1 Tax=Riccia sorocarpa TaxID=122646 RepID=A0ABD3I7L7_9MARC